MPQPSQLASYSPEWYEIKGRLFRFFGTQPGWARWHQPQGDHPEAWICGQEKDRDHELSRGTRIAAVLKDPRLIASRSFPERHAYADVTSRGWNRLLRGVFTYLGGPALLDDIVTVVGVLLHVPEFEGLPCGAPVAPPESSAAHVTYEEMDALVDNALDGAVRHTIAAHADECPFCARQLAAYESAAPQVSAPFQKQSSA